MPAQALHRPAVSPTCCAGPLTTTDLQDFLGRLPGLDLGVGDAERIDQIALLESIKGAVAGAQARVTAAFAESQREEQPAAGVPARERGRGVGAQVALARRESPSRGSRHVGFAAAMVHEMRHTMAHLERGAVSEWRATIMCRETACLSVEDRAVVDEALSQDLPGLSDGQVEARAKALACQLDAAAMTKRAAKAHSERRVSMRPAPDTMTYLTALLPVAEGVAVFAALQRAAGSARAEGDDRCRGQVMADTLVERVTGQSVASAVPIEVQLVMSAQTAAGTSQEPALMAGHVLPADAARHLVDRCAAAGASVTIRRLLTTDDGADLTGVESRPRTVEPSPSIRAALVRISDDEADTGVGSVVSANAAGTRGSTVSSSAQSDTFVGSDAIQSGRRFTGLPRRFIELRDQVCRTPWCDAPIRHADHALAARAEGPTTTTNGQGLCEACNYAKEAPGWRARSARAGPGAHTVRTTTPTGHSYDSTAPPILPSRTRRRAPVPDRPVVDLRWPDRIFTLDVRAAA